MSLIFLLIPTKDNLFDTHVPINKMSLFSIIYEFVFREHGFKHICAWASYTFP